MRPWNVPPILTTDLTALNLIKPLSQGLTWFVRMNSR